MIHQRGQFFLLLFVGGALSQRENERCYDEKSNFVGRCRRQNDCPSAGSYFASTGIRPSYCEYSVRRVLVCCREGNSFRPSSTTTQRPVTEERPIWGLGLSNGNKRISERKCEEYSKAVINQVDFISLLPEPETMSITDVNCNYTGVELIVGGENAQQGEFPHMAAIGWPGLGGGVAFSCGGSLISNKFVLSAGHCNKRPRFGEPTVVRLGEQNMNPSVRDGANPIDVQIKKIHKHPDYKPPNRYNDITLFELAEEVKFNDNVRPACLWNKPGFGGHKKALATGWGVTNPDTMETSDELQKVSLFLLSNDYCSTLLDTNRYWDGFIPSQMCAGELRGGKDTCQGDSGSPLQVVSEENQCIFYVVGITSFGGKCAKSGQPAVYTRVSSYLDWIESVVWPGQ
ncbi:trypsin-1-like [Battus philenor]|uniref:trypsin-1-like n=1 Tax=Battus philenor TaxID=42288 RepID=UPI0035D04807